MIKGYTDIEQSKELAKILPLNTADMHYATWTIFGGFIVSPNQGNTIEDLQEDYGNQIIPCWSIAALLDILPLEVSFNKQTDGVDTYYYIASCDARYCDVYTHRHINVVDACYEMVIKLKEKNLI